MYTKTILVTAFLATFVAASPMAAKINVPITESEWQAIREGGLQGRSPEAKKVNVPITDLEMESLKAGLAGRRLQARDGVVNCGLQLNGKKRTGGKGVWVPVDTFLDKAKDFCKFSSLPIPLVFKHPTDVIDETGGSTAGTDVSERHETSDSYGVKLTNQKNPSQPGDDANLVFGIYNIERDTPYLVNVDTCMSAMKAPIASHIQKRDGASYVVLGKRDTCFGSKNRDYEGGWYKEDGVAIGTEINK